MGSGNYKSRVGGLEDNTFDVGTLSAPAKFSKLLKNIETYIQRTYKSSKDIVKAIQQMARPTLDYPAMPSKKDCKDKDGNKDPVAFKMMVFTWKGDYKAMRARKDRYRDNESNISSAPQN